MTQTQTVRPINDILTELQVAIAQIKTCNWRDTDGSLRPAVISYEEAMRSLYNENERAGQLKVRLEHEQKANARLLKTIEEVCSERDEALGKLDEVQGRLSDLMSYLTCERDEVLEPEPGQCWRVIRNGNIYRWNTDGTDIEYWSPTDKHWLYTVWESFTAIEKELGDLEPVENPESNA